MGHCLGEDLQSGRLFKIAEAVARFKDKVNAIDTAAQKQETPIGAT